MRRRAAELARLADAKDIESCRGSRRGWDITPRVVVFAVVLVTALLAGLDVASLHSPQGRTQDWWFGTYAPRLTSSVVWWGALAVIALVATYWLVVVTRTRDQLRSAYVVGGTVLLMLALGWVINQARGEPHETYRMFLRTTSQSVADYPADVPALRTLGFVRFVEDFPHLNAILLSIHSRTHPPGAVATFAALEGLLPRQPATQALVLALLGASVVIPTWFLCRAWLDESASRYAIVLLAVMTSPLLFEFASFDSALATLLVADIALWAWAVRRRSVRLAAATGFAVGLTSFFTYAISFVALFCALYGVVVLRRELVRLLPLAYTAALFGALALLTLRVSIGYDVFASYDSVSAPPGVRETVFGWLAADPLGWATGAGSVIFALAVLGVRRVAWPLLLFVPLVAFATLPSSVTKLVPGELERTWLFTYPLLAIMAGVTLTACAWRSTRQRTAVLGGLIALGIGQSVLLEALVYNWW